MSSFFLFWKKKSSESDKRWAQLYFFFPHRVAHLRNKNLCCHKQSILVAWKNRKFWEITFFLGFCSSFNKLRIKKRAIPIDYSKTCVLVQWAVDYGIDLYVSCTFGFEAIKVVLEKFFGDFRWVFLESFEIFEKFRIVWFHI